MSPHSRPADHEARKKGVIYLDETRATSPATHVLVIGVGAYLSDDFKDPLDTATISARAFADWFVAPGKARFKNDACPLGSVAVLLSEQTKGAQSIYAGGPVPRATFANTQAAVAAWARRIDTHKDNLAILYVASHGESFLNKLAFLLEDFGINDDVATAGMANVDVLASSLEYTAATSQLLLFDCCQSPTPMSLAPGDQFGQTLIQWTQASSKHNDDRNQWLICATSKGRVALGLTDGPTLFNMALLDALNGVAADSGSQGWPVRPAPLIDRIARILKLYRLPTEKAQTPAGKMAGSFDITFPGEPEPADYPVYVAYDDPAQWPGSAIALSVDGTAGSAMPCKKGDLPYHCQRVKELADVVASANKGGVPIGSAKGKLRPTALFLEIGSPPQKQITEKKDPTRASGIGGLEMQVTSHAYVNKGAFAKIDRMVGTRNLGTAWEGTLDLNKQTSASLDPGDYRINVQTPDGLTQTRSVTISGGTVVSVPFETTRSDNEWMADAILADAIPPLVPDQPADPLVSIKAFGYATIQPGSWTLGDPDLSLKPEREDGRFTRYALYDPGPQRFPGGNPDAWKHPTFAMIVTNAERRELVVLPSVGSTGTDKWKPYLLIDNRAPPDQPMSGAFVESKGWGSLLATLGSRNFVMASRLLDASLVNEATAVLHDTNPNPLASIACALLAASAGSPDIKARLDKWLTKITEWFGSIPDAHIILARRRMQQARDASQIKEAVQGFKTAFALGIPVYSLSVDWLARGLESCPKEIEDVEELAISARWLASRVDPTRAFTVVRLRDPKIVRPPDTGEEHPKKEAL